MYNIKTKGLPNKLESYDDPVMYAKILQYSIEIDRPIKQSALESLNNLLNCHLRNLHMKYVTVKTYTDRHGYANVATNTIKLQMRISTEDYGQDTLIRKFEGFLQDLGRELSFITSRDRRELPTLINSANNGLMGELLLWRLRGGF